MNCRFYFWKRASLIVVVGLFSAKLLANFLQLVSVRDPGEQSSATGSGNSLLPVMSSDGRYVLFASTANDLVLTTNGNPIRVLIPPRQNVYLRDRQSGSTTLVSVDTLGRGGADENATPTGISSDGRFALFESSASNLFPGVTNGANQIFIRDLASNATFLVSIATNSGAGNGPSRSSMMTQDSRFVVFVSEADNLVENDTNGIPDIFVRDLQRRVTVLASPGAMSTNSNLAVGGSESPVITPDGRYVAFYSTATNLVSGDNIGGNIYVRDLVASTTVWVSSQARSMLASVTLTSNAVAHSQSISADGRYVAYVVSPPPPTSLFDPRVSTASGIILRNDLQTGIADLITTNCNVPAGAFQDLRILDMTPDGRFIAFVGNTNGNDGNTTCINVWDASTAVVTLASGDQSNAVPVGTVCQWPVLNSGGTSLAFFSSPPILTTNATDGDLHLYVRDLLAQTTSIVDLNTNGTGSTLNPVTIPRLSEDGRFIAFECADDRLIANDRNHSYDVFVRDLAGNTTELISEIAPGLSSKTANGNSSGPRTSVSKDGHFVAFESDADDLVGNDTNGYRDVFVRDLVAGSNILVSVDTAGLSSGNGVSYEPSISADGRYVAFASSADNLVPGDTNGAPDIFVRDLKTGVTTLVSTNTSGSGPLRPLPDGGSISADGHFVLFQSQSSLFVRNQQDGTFYSLTPAGLSSFTLSEARSFAAFIDTPNASLGSVSVWSSQAAATIYTNANLGAISVLAVANDGNTIVYSTASNQLLAANHAANTNWAIDSGFSGVNAGFSFSADGRFLVFATSPTPAGANQVYLYDFQSQAKSLVSHRYNSSFPASGNSDSPAISADGRFVAFRSDAANIVPNDTNGVPDIFLYDRLTQTSTALSASRFGSWTPDGRSLAPVFSGDGFTLIFQSFASDLVTQDFNQREDIVSFTVLGANIDQAPALGSGFWVSWPTIPGQNYRVQCKISLRDPAWADASGTVTNIGTRAYFSDSAPVSGQKFYRITRF